MTTHQKILADLKSYNFSLLALSGQKASEKVAMQVGLDLRGPNSQICALNSISSIFNLILQKISLIFPASL